MLADEDLIMLDDGTLVSLDDLLGMMNVSQLGNNMLMDEGGQFMHQDDLLLKMGARLIVPILTRAGDFGVDIATGAITKGADLANGAIQNTWGRVKDSVIGNRLENILN